MIERLRGEGSERGAIIVMVVICMLAIFIIMAVVIDIGASLVVKRQVVAAADSAALAAAQSCALGKGVADAESQANAYATENRSGVAGGIESGNCVTPAGSLTTAYETDVEYKVAPIAGLGDSKSVGARATAIWGPAQTLTGSVPVMLDASWLKDKCDLPNAAIGTQCAFWYDNNNTTVGSQNNWGFMNLDQWDVAADAHCSNAGASSRGAWIVGGYPGDLTVNYPAPTYVCSDSGHASGNWLTQLESTIGTIRSFPVVDPTQQIPALPEAADKYDVVGWTDLQITQVLKGNDPAAIGSTTSSTCTGTWTPLPVKNGTKSGAAVLFSCGVPADATVSDPQVKATRAKNFVDCKGNKIPNNAAFVFLAGCDYSYDPATQVVTWLDNKLPSGATLSLSFPWTLTSGGACPDHESNPNAVCLVTKWMGTHIGGSNPCQNNCPNFGLPAIRLSE